MDTQSNKDQDRQTASNVLYEDNHIIIINKKPSEIVQGDKTGDISLLENTKQFLKKKYNKPGNVFLGLVHRIDRPVSGALIFAKTGKALTRLNEMLKKREIKKIYWAVVKNTPPSESDHLIHFLKRNQKQNKSYASETEKAGSQKAELKYKMIAKSKDYYLVEIELQTGRHHQIRAQLAAIGCPIKGDLKYGYPRSNKDASIHLHSRKTEFIHPVKKDKTSVTAPVPDDNLWTYFESLFTS